MTAVTAFWDATADCPRLIAALLKLKESRDWKDIALTPE